MRPTVLLPFLLAVCAGNAAERKLNLRGEVVLMTGGDGAVYTSYSDSIVTLMTPVTKKVRVAILITRITTDEQGGVKTLTATLETPDEPVSPKTTSMSKTKPADPIITKGPELGEKKPYISTIVSTVSKCSDVKKGEPKTCTPILTTEVVTLTTTTTLSTEISMVVTCSKAKECSTSTEEIVHTITTVCPISTVQVTTMETVTESGSSPSPTPIKSTATVDKPKNKPTTTVGESTDKPITTVNKSTDKPITTVNESIDKPTTTVDKPTDKPKIITTPTEEKPGTTLQTTTGKYVTTTQAPPTPETTKLCDDLVLTKMGLWKDGPIIATHAEGKKAYVTVGSEIWQLPGDQTTLWTVSINTHHPGEQGNKDVQGDKFGTNKPKVRRARRSLY